VSEVDPNAARWLGLRCRNLPLKVLADAAQGAVPPGPWIVVSNDHRPEVIAANDDALAIGISIGMGQQTALAHRAGTRVWVHRPAAQQALIERICLALHAVSSEIWQASDHELILEGGHSFALHGGPAGVTRQVGIALATQRVQARLSWSETPWGALLKCRSGSRSVDGVQLHQVGLPTAKLNTFGMRTIGELRKLSRAGVARRVGTEWTDTLDLIESGGIDPQWQRYVPNPRATARIDLLQPAHTIDGAQFALRRALNLLCLNLSARGRGVLTLDVALAHPRGEPTRATLDFGAAQREPDPLERALKLKLERAPLRDELIAITLTTINDSPLDAAQGDLFSHKDQSIAQAKAEVLDRLRARLGADALKHPRLSSDFRLRVEYFGPREHLPDGPRPLLITPKPERIARSAFEFLIGPERIEAGWWDGNDEARDYYVATMRDGALALVSENLRDRGKWWLDGWFE
jgi:protein ImuB